ncbi:MAG: hypothetical protein J6M43_09470 [Neisseriaceae bacterium]|nr:hypothetical protein [Neisseriaceae bacterium]
MIDKTDKLDKGLSVFFRLPEKWGLGVLVGKNAHPTAFLLLFRQPERFSVVMVGKNTHAIIL